MEAVHESSRSTLYLDRATGLLHRRYHDTGAWAEPYLPARERRVAERAYAGARDRPAPAYVCNALRVLCASRDVDDFARRLAVKATTAWAYACEVVERWPAACEVAEPLVDAEVMRALRECDDLSGSLRDVLRRADVVRKAGPDVRTLPNLYAHVRLARLVLLAARPGASRPK